MKNPYAFSPYIVDKTAKNGDVYTIFCNNL